MDKFAANDIKMELVRLISVWIKLGHFAYAKPCGKAMVNIELARFVHIFSTLDHPLSRLRQIKFFKKFSKKIVLLYFLMIFQ